MTIDGMRNALACVAVALATLGLAGCLGGEAGSSGASSGGSSSGGSTTGSGKPTVSLALASSQSATTANTVTAVTFGTSIYAVATVKNASGAPVANAVVSFAAANPMVVFTPVNASALTGSDGKALIQLDSASITDAGATSLTASADVTTTSNGVSTTATYTSAPLGVAVNASTVTLGSLTLTTGGDAANPISAYGTSTVTVPVLINNVTTNAPIAVTFSSPCVTSGKATLSNPVTAVNGTATATYKDDNCASGSDVITASVSGSSNTTTIYVDVPRANNLQFISATPPTIGIQNAGSSLLQNSIVKFKVVDNNNNAKAGVRVDFSLLVNNPGAGVIYSPASGTTDSNGEVSTSVTSGTVPTPVTVVAKVHDIPSIKSQSNTLTITTGVPAQDFFSLSVQTANIEGLDYDGVTSSLMVIASDRLGNPVPDGTAVNFITEGGQIVPPSCTTTSGTCSVTFKSAQYKPSNGRVTVLAYASGEESFVDTNGNNMYDPALGEPFSDLGDPFIDSNESNFRDAGEQYISFASGGSSDCPMSTTQVPSVTKSCDGKWGNNYVRRGTVLILSASTPVPFVMSPSNMGGCNQTFSFILQDKNGHPLPAGTTIALGNINTLQYQVSNSSGASWGGKATLSLSRATVPNSDQATPVDVSVEAIVSPTTLLCIDGGVVGPGDHWPTGDFNLLIKTPMGIETSMPVHINP